MYVSDTPAIFNPSALNDNSLVALSTKIRDRRSTFCIPVIQVSILLLLIPTDS